MSSAVGGVHAPVRGSDLYNKSNRLQHQRVAVWEEALFSRDGVAQSPR